MKLFLVVASIMILALSSLILQAENSERMEKKPFPAGVCPPFNLRDEDGNIIDPLHNFNANKPYSPKETCGAKGCHDYKKITEGFHFQQGKGERPTGEMVKRYLWMSSPGDYGGTWCSPAPLYRSLAPKKNSKARMIDMTSFDFVTATCGNCHPGGGPLEYDRQGNRYDEYMKRQGMSSGGDNGLDGDYYKARWTETGVIEADCLLCHLPEYNFKERNQSLANLNFKWAATSGSGLGKVEGSIKDNKPVKVAYDKSKLDEDGMLSLHIVSEPRNAACLQCHAKPDWKKKGASYTVRTDVHIKAGLRCIDCHAGGSHAVDPRIRGKEVHQFGKGDDPSGHVRDDLDNTMRQCADCHTSGYLGAPIAEHKGLPPLHLEKVACQTCHIPWRYVKSAQAQMSDVFNKGPKIDPPAKHIWTFYDARMNYWNHYGELAMFTKDDQPTTQYSPSLIRYKGKIYPANRVHSAWPGIVEEGKSGLNQPFMKDVFMMWKAHNEDPSKYPDLSKITDDNGDGVPEVNRPEEIDGVINSVRQYLTDTGFGLTGKKIVWVSNDRVYYSGSDWKKLPKHDYEASPYASVYKYSHDVAPARAALGANGCTDCHHRQSFFFNGKVLETPFDAVAAKPLWIQNSVVLGINPFWKGIGIFREQFLKPFLYGVIALVIFMGTIGILKSIAIGNGLLSARAAAIVARCLVGLFCIGGIVAAATPGLLSYMTMSRSTLDANHFWIAVMLLVIGVVLALQAIGGQSTTEKILPILPRLLWPVIVFTALCGAIMLLKVSWLDNLTRLAYTGFDIGLAALGLVILFILVLKALSRRESRQ